MNKALLMILTVALSAGCGTERCMDLQRLEKGLVVVLSGIEGRSPLTHNITRGLADGGVDGAIETYTWTSPWGGLLYNLRAEERNRKQAQKLARRIEEYLCDFPGRPVYLIGQSGGAAIAAWAVEDLGGGLRVDGIVMIAPALSPAYLLDLALSNCHQGVVNFYSERDVMLSVGTTVNGTMDGRHTASAGRTGFKAGGAGGRPAGYDRLYQVGWRAEMARTGHFGNHLSSSAAQFISKYVAPLIRADTWSQEVIDKIVAGKRVEKRQVALADPAER